MGVLPGTKHAAMFPTKPLLHLFHRAPGWLLCSLLRGMLDSAQCSISLLLRLLLALLNLAAHLCCEHCIFGDLTVNKRQSNFAGALWIQEFHKPEDAIGCFDFVAQHSKCLSRNDPHTIHIHTFEGILETAIAVLAKILELFQHRRSFGVEAIQADLFGFLRHAGLEYPFCFESQRVLATFWGHQTSSLQSFHELIYVLDGKFQLWVQRKAPCLCNASKFVLKSSNELLPSITSILL
mmetsp:Transcript_121483/g.288723  ORF Transcript_121483/g.288723 Transcript_121483/m.288723 type:complete len:237 (+) Transcript_121483:1108-1818(+)